jgi:hypothetical protein
MGKYKFGKQEEIISFQQFSEKMAQAHLGEEETAFMWMIYWIGPRKSEMYERVSEDCAIIIIHKEINSLGKEVKTQKLLTFPLGNNFTFAGNDEVYFSLDLHKRKKNGAEVPALELPYRWPGIDLTVKMAELAAERRPTGKTIFTYEPSGLFKKMKGGKKKELKSRHGKTVKAHYIFPNIQSTKAWELAKQVLGEKFYAHYLRLNRLTEIGSDPEANLIRLKSISGIKSTRALEKYLGTSKKQQTAAIRFMDDQVNSGQ